MKRTATIGLSALCAASLVGCGLVEERRAEPEPVPTQQDLRGLRATSSPIWWLGERFRGHRLTYAYRVAGGVELRYGAPRCEGDADMGCAYPIAIHSSADRRGALPFRHERREDFPEPRFERVSGGILLDWTGDRREWAVARSFFRGRHAISLTTDGQARATKIPGRTLIEAVRPFNAAARMLPRLQAPEPLSCARLRDVPRWFRNQMPLALAPPACRTR